MSPVLFDIIELRGRLAKERRLRGWSQDELAARLGKFSGVVICRWEIGERQPSLFDLCCWANVLGMKLTAEVRPCDTANTMPKK